MFEIVYDDDDDDGRMTDGRRLDGYPISSPCEPNGSGELKMPKVFHGLGQDFFCIKFLVVSDFEALLK